MGERTLVCGAGGFIGGHLVRSLLDDGHRVRAVDVKHPARWHQLHDDAENVVLDLRRPECCSLALTARGVDVVYNLAADMGGMGFIESHKLDCMLSSLVNTNLLLASRGCSGRYFFASSACVYNADKQLSVDPTPLREEDAYPALPEDGYGWEKLFAERMCRHFREDRGLPTRVARLHNVYGPRGTWDGGREKAPAAVCRKVAQAKLTGNHSILIWGTGRQTRTFTYVDDCVRGIRQVAEGDHPDPVNLGSAELVSVDELVSTAEKIAGVTLRRHYDPGAPTGVVGRRPDNTLFREVYGWEPSTKLAVGLEETYRWIYDELAAGRSGR